MRQSIFEVVTELVICSSEGVEGKDSSSPASLSTSAGELKMRD